MYILYFAEYPMEALLEDWLISIPSFCAYLIVFNQWRSSVTKSGGAQFFPTFSQKSEKQKKKKGHIGVK